MRLPFFRRSLLSFGSFFSVRIIYPCLLLILAAVSLPAQNGPGETVDMRYERILDYHTRIEVRTDRSILVTETLKVNVTGSVIQRGITRYLPGSRYLNDRSMSMRYDIESVKRDGRKEPYKNESANGGRMLYVGHKDVFLDPGIYTYEIVYRVPGQIGFYDEYDEIYWNAIGNEVQFPVDRASCEVILPEGTAVVQQAAYIGYAGEQGTDFSFSQDGNVLSYRATRPLNPGEGFTVAVGFEKGIIETPGWLARFGTLLLLGLSTLLLIPYYFVTWMRHGRDPQTPASYPIWEAPDGLSAASVNYIKNGSFQSRCLTASVIHLAIKGYLKIEEKETSILFFKSRTYTLRKLKEADGSLPAEERKLLEKLFRSSSVVEIDGKYDSTIEKAYAAHKSSLSSQHRSLIWKGHNSHLLVVPILVTLASIILGIVILVNSPYAPGDNVYAMLGFVPVSIASLFVYGYLIRKPTMEKLDLRSRIKGFELYLEMAEADRLRLLNPPEMTPEHFEGILPYAFALGVEHEWSDKFKSILEKAQYQPQWHNSRTPMYFADSFGRNFAQSMSGSATKPSKSGSGSGGGGFSGGGGGGGGVGGW